MIFTDIRNFLQSKSKEEISYVEDENQLASGHQGDDSLEKEPMLTDILPHSAFQGQSGDQPRPESPAGMDLSKNPSQNLLSQTRGAENPSSAKPSLEHLEKLSIEDITQLFRIRIKNNHLGQIHYFPSKWSGNLSL